MTKENIILSDEEFLVLEKILEKRLLAFFSKTSNRYLIPKNIENNIEIGDILTLELAKNGFNNDYSINKDGIILENLIEKFLQAKL